MNSETISYRYFKVERDSDGRLYYASQKQHNTIYPGVFMEEGGLMLGVTPRGIYIHGDAGQNTFVPMAREWVEVLREAVNAFDSYQQKPKPLDQWLKDEAFSMVLRRPKEAEICEGIVQRAIEGERLIDIHVDDDSIYIPDILLLLHFQRLDFPEIRVYGRNIIVPFHSVTGVSE